MIDLNDNLNIKTPKPIRPIDIIGVGCLYLTKEDIPANVRYDGLQVYVLSNNVNYQLNGGITDSDWVIIASSNTTVPYTLDVRRLLQSNNGNSIFIGEGAGENDDLSDNKNVAVGINSMYSNITGNLNTSVGYNSLYNNNNGYLNVAVGYQSMHLSENGVSNVAIGPTVLYSNTTGSYNVAIGLEAMYNNTFGSNNVSLGQKSLMNNLTGNFNTAIGQNALITHLYGNDNTGIGSNAGHFISSGANNETGIDNVFIGADTRASADGTTNELVIGSNAIGKGSNQAVILDDNGTDVWMGENGQCIVHAKATQTTLLSGALSNPPTKAEIEALGISVTVGSGYEVNVWDTANSIMYNINTGGTDWFYVAKTKAL